MNNLLKVRSLVMGGSNGIHATVTNIIIVTHFAQSVQIC